jgi:hypothetical protein
MKQGILQVCCIVIVLVFISTSACVAPPKPGSSTSIPGTGSSQTGSEIVTATGTSVPMYVTIVTPFSTPNTNEIKNKTTPAPTEIPEEWVNIYHDSRFYTFNASAVNFDLKNPPMVINFSVIPTNMTGKKYTYKNNADGTTTETSYDYDYYSPYSWFELTIRNEDSGKILLQKGFGSSYGKQYSTEINQTIKVLNRENIQVEMNGNQITAIIDLYVKKKDNIM